MYCLVGLSFKYLTVSPWLTGVLMLFIFANFLYGVYEGLVNHSLDPVLLIGVIQIFERNVGRNFYLINFLYYHLPGWQFYGRMLGFPSGRCSGYFSSLYIYLLYLVKLHLILLSYEDTFSPKRDMYHAFHINSKSN